MTWSFLAARSCDPAQFHAANQQIAAVTHNPNHSILGIIGLGKIGFRLAQKASTAFQMRIWYHDIERMEEREHALPEGAKWCETLDELLVGSDCVVLATPFEGKVLLSKKEFAQFKKGARLVNIARGKLVDEEALMDALDEGVISSAGLDVHADEPNVNQRLARRDNVMVLSECFSFLLHDVLSDCWKPGHTAGASVESHIGFERLGIENLMNFFREGKALTPVNLHWLRTGNEVVESAVLS